MCINDSYIESQLMCDIYMIMDDFLWLCCATPHSVSHSFDSGCRLVVMKENCDGAAPFGHRCSRSHEACLVAIRLPWQLHPQFVIYLWIMSVHKLRWNIYYECFPGIVLVPLPTMFRHQDLQLSFVDSMCKPKNLKTPSLCNVTKVEVTLLLVWSLVNVASCKRSVQGHLVNTPIPSS